MFSNKSQKKLLHLAAAPPVIGVLLAGPLTTPPASADVTNVCTGFTVCEVVAPADIDGDKKADEIGIVYKRDSTNNDGRWLIAVRVKTATRTMQTTGRDVAWFGEPLYAVAPVDGQAGKEIVVGDITGANTYWFRVITYRNGKLLTLKPPSKNEARPARWGILDSNYAQYGYARHVSATGVVSMVDQYAERNNSGHGYTGKKVTYHWKSGKWVKVSTKTVRYASYKSAHAIAGWHVKGLPAWPA